ncbi:hypothetical protein ACGFSI_29630 [Streptomyces virginiae]|uniref:hypothetical protein n=1 Tax=Streptomyces virginiae TaxID=1961 RepID=UPI003718BC11
MACTNLQCNGGIVPNPHSDAPEDLTLCLGCNHGFDPRDYAGWLSPGPGASRGPQGSRYNNGVRQSAVGQGTDVAAVFLQP